MNTPYRESCTRCAELEQKIEELENKPCEKCQKNEEKKRNQKIAKETKWRSRINLMKRSWKEDPPLSVLITIFVLFLVITLIALIVFSVRKARDPDPYQGLPDCRPKTCVCVGGVPIR